MGIVQTLGSSTGFGFVIILVKKTCGLIFPARSRCFGQSLSLHSENKMLCYLCCMNTRLRLLRNRSSTAHQPEPRFKTALSYVTLLFSEWHIETNFSLFFLSYVKGHKKLRKCLLPSFAIFYSSKDIKVQSYHKEYSVPVSPVSLLSPICQVFSKHL